jgi:hypothetical protein
MESKNTNKKNPSMKQRLRSQVIHHPIMTMLSMILDFHMCKPKHETKVAFDSHFDLKPDFLRHYYKIDVEDNKRVEDNTDEDKAEEEGGEC